MSQNQQATREFFQTFAQAYLQPDPVPEPRRDQTSHPDALAFSGQLELGTVRPFLEGARFSQLFEFNFVRDEGDSQDLLLIVGSGQATALLRVWESAQGTFNHVSGEILVHEDDQALKAQYRAQLLTRLLKELAAPLQAAIDKLGADPYPFEVPAVSEIVQPPLSGKVQVKSVRTLHVAPGVYAEIVGATGFTMSCRLDEKSSETATALRARAVEERKRGDRILLGAIRLQAAADWVDANPPQVKD